MNSTRKKHNDMVKAMKRMAREEYGFAPTRIRENKKKYRRDRRKYNYEEDC